jgi:integrase
MAGKKISGSKAKGFGKFARLHVEKGTLGKILEWIKGLNFQAYAIDHFMLKTGTRITATLNARTENLLEFEDHAEIRVFDKARRSIHPEGKEWIKYLDLLLLTELKKIIGDRKAGKIFSMSKPEMARINKVALENFIPEIVKEYGHIMPNHFWRHMFAQHMLRITEWNYGLVGELGGWTPKALEELKEKHLPTWTIMDNLHFSSELKTIIFELHYSFIVLTCVQSAFQLVF